jgi:hypothetical protein
VQARTAREVLRHQRVDASAPPAPVDSDIDSGGR